MPRAKYHGPSEADIQRTCTEYLALDGWRPLRTDPVGDRARGKGFGERGMADMLYLRYDGTPPLWIEWKRLKANGQPTKAAAHQQEWHAAERARGALTLIAGEDFPATIEGFIEWYEASGLRYRGRKQ